MIRLSEKQPSRSDFHPCPYRGEPLKGPLEVKIVLWWPDRRKHHVDNFKAILDALTSIVWQDDGQIESLCCQFTIKLSRVFFCRPKKSVHIPCLRPSELSENAGAAWVTRTPDPRITNALLYRLS